MAQARAACDMLDEETEDRHRARALEAAIAVCYARAFTQSTLRRLDAHVFAPTLGTSHLTVHDMLLALRHKVYAHTDEDSGRSIERLTIDFQGDIASVTHVERGTPSTATCSIRSASCATTRLRGCAWRAFASWGRSAPRWTRTTPMEVYWTLGSYDIVAWLRGSAFV
jgi:hypothetical protein